jgi:hypothetical protein
MDSLPEMRAKAHTSVLRLKVKFRRPQRYFQQYFARVEPPCRSCPYARACGS